MIKTLTLLTTAALLTAPCQAALIGWQAEDGASNSGTVTASLGALFDPAISGGVTGALGDSYITTESDGPGEVPGTNDRIATYQITFTEAGEYDLYARVRIIGGAGDDSFLYAREFGVGDPNNDGTPFGWAKVNGLINTTNAVNEWVWVNVATNTGDVGDPGSSLTVGSAGTLTYQIGGRETGLLIDALAFGTTGETFTAQQLDNSVVIPEPGSLALLGLGGLLIARRRRA